MTIPGIDERVYSDLAPHHPHPGVARVAVWITLGSASWAALVTSVMLASRLVG